MNFSLPAIVACTCFYSGFYYYFAKQAQPILFIIGIILWVIAVIITPSAYEARKRNHFNQTLWYDNWFTYPLIT